MAATALHYVFDPLCGWCYAASPLVAAARAILPVHFHAGGMMAGPQRQQASRELRAYIRPHNQRITALTGLEFGAAFEDGLLLDATAMLDSEPPTTAILAAEACGGRGLDLLAALQRALYVEGRRLDQKAVLQAIATEAGLDTDAFAREYAAQAGTPTWNHIEESRGLLRRLRGRGFPTFALERDGRWRTLDFGTYLGNPDAWRAQLTAALG